MYQKKLNLNQVVQIYSTNPAKNYKIQNKGDLIEGFDADIVIVDPNQKLFVDQNIVFSKCGWTPYQDMTLQGGCVVMTILGGQVVFDNGRIVASTTGKSIIIQN